MASTQGARKALAFNLKLQRFLRGWTQEHLADVAGLHRTHISAIERARCSVTLDNIERLAFALKVPLPDLFAPRAAPAARPPAE